MTEEQQIASTIISQIGGRKAFFMLGAKQVTSHKIDGQIRGGLTFRIGRNHRSISHIEILLNASDYYDMQFLRVSNGRKRGFVRKVVSEFHDVDFEMLPEIIREQTGMETRMPSVVGL